jgi:hypothetical protein
MWSRMSSATTRSAWTASSRSPPGAHHQDIRRALGRPRAIPPERLLPALRIALIAPDIGGLWRIRGVRLVATDLRFSAGAGPQVRGAAEALLMTMAGRRGVVDELHGQGQARLAGRIGG